MALEPICVRRLDETPYHGLYGSELEVLGTYNAERARGIVHTPEWDARMADLQGRFDAASPEWTRP